MDKTRRREESIKLTPFSIIGSPIPIVIILVAILGSASCRAENTDAGSENWLFRSGLVLSGNSDESEPAGLKAYSGVAIEIGVRRRLRHSLAAELSLRTESREIDQEMPPQPPERLGSIEMAPVAFTLLYSPSYSGRFHPYVGFGVCLTLAWEKSGVLDSLDIAPYIGPAIQLDLDYDLSDIAVLNADLRWNMLRSDIKLAGERFAKLKIDPIVLGFSVGFRF